VTDPFESLEPSVRRKRHPIRNTIIVLVIIAVLGVSGYFVANSLATSFALTAVKTGVVQETGANASDVHVNLGKKAILPQIIGRQLDHVHVTIDSFTSGTLTGSAVFDATGVPLSTSGPASEISIAVSIGDEGLLELVQSEAGQTQSQAKIVDGGISVTSKEKVLGHTVAASVDFVVSSSGYNLVLTPRTIHFGGKAYTPTALKKSIYGPLVKGLITTRTQCLAAGLPSAMHLTGVQVVGSRIVVSATGTDLSLQSLSSKGTCPAT